MTFTEIECRDSDPSISVDVAFLLGVSVTKTPLLRRLGRVEAEAGQNVEISTAHSNPVP